VIKRHVSAEEIARFGEGDVSGRKAARISSHLASCHHCAKVRDDLAMVPALLASTTAPPMPDHLTARIQTALMTESARRASPEAGAGSPGDRRPARHAAGWSWPRIPGLSARSAGWVAAAAAAVVIAGGGSYLIVSGNGSGSNSGTASSAGSAARAPRTAAGAAAPAAPVKRGLGPQLEYQRAGQQAQFTPIVTGTNYLSSQLTSQVQGTLTDYRKAVATSGTTKVVPHATQGLNATQSREPSQIGAFAPSALEGCVTRISAGALVVLVDVASYQGSAAAVIVTERAAQGPQQVSVVGTGCSASSSDVLTRTTLPSGG
jgi:hypothetical protein